VLWGKLQACPTTRFWENIILAAPMKTVPGTIMPPSIDDPQEIDDLIAYLKTLR